ncbi:MAG: SpoIID/LytB domain-containing protein [Bacillota bacterium]|jgi:stage II sporulation protein D
MRKYLLTGLVLLTLTFTPAPGRAETAQLVRVGLTWGQSRLQIPLNSTDTVYQNGKLQSILGPYATETPVVFTAAGDKLYLNGVCLGNNPVRLVPGATFLTWNGRKYRGEFWVSARQGKLTLVNRLPLEEYLRGVLPKEVVPEWPMAALKAQAIAARTYTLANLGKHAAEGFDLCTTVHCQVSEGASCETPTTDRAVAETAGKVLVYRGKLINAYYHASSGGATMDADDIWGPQAKADYLKGVPDWDQNSPRGEWYRSVEWSDLQAAVARSYPQLGRLIRITPAALSAKGLVLKVRLVGSGGETVIAGEEFRFLVNLYSSNIQMAVVYGPEPTITLWWVKNNPYPDVFIANNTIPGLVAEAIVPPWDTPDPWQWLQDKTPLRVVLRGSGWGHRIGMSQWGAKGMADAGYNEVQILKHYYRGSAIVDVKDLSKYVGK